MTDDPKQARFSETDGNLLGLALLALVAGALAGLVGAIFRLLLQQSDRLRDALIAWAHGRAALGFLLVVVACSAATALAAWLVRRFSPQASGSGIPHVEAVLHGNVRPPLFG
jgi:CIC family chloride channel protein